MADRRWFYRRCGEVYGPLNVTDLRAAAFLGFLKPDDLVRDVASDTWIAAGSIAQLGAAFPCSIALGKTTPTTHRDQQRSD